MKILQQAPAMQARRVMHDSPRGEVVDDSSDFS